MKNSERREIGKKKDILELLTSLNNHEVFTPPAISNDMLDLLPKRVWKDPSIRILDPACKSGVFLRESFFRLFEGLDEWAKGSIDEDGKSNFNAYDGRIYDLKNPQQRVNHILSNMIYGISTGELTGYLSRRILYGTMLPNSSKEEYIFTYLASLQSGGNRQSKYQSKYRTNEQVNSQLEVTTNSVNLYFKEEIFAKNSNYDGYQMEGNIFYPHKKVDEKIKKLEEEKKDTFGIEDTFFPFLEENTGHRFIESIQKQKFYFTREEEEIINEWTKTNKQNKNRPFEGFWDKQAGEYDMKFDVIIGNPPYQLSDGSGKGAGAVPIYQKFISQAKRLNPRYLTMITPSRYFSGGRGLDKFRNEMLHDDRIRAIHDYINASDCFPGVEIKGGVNYFLWERDSQGECEINTYENSKLVSTQTRPLLEEGASVFIRYNQAIPIFRKVQDNSVVSFNNIISSRKPFGLRTLFKGKTEPFKNSIKIYQNKGIGYIKREEVLQNHDWIDMHKVIAPYAVGSGDSKTDIIKPIYSEPGSCCSETYIVFGPTKDKKEAENIISYIKTKFFHFMVTLKKNTQHATKGAYQFVPMQDFSESWTDEKLYKKYNLNEKEIGFIESMIKEMK